MKKNAKALAKALESMGYVYAGRNAKSADIFEHGNGHRVAISSSAAEHACRDLLKQAQERCGVSAPPSNKRNTAEIKRRQSVEREAQRQEVAAHRSLIEDLLAQRDRLLGGYAANLTNRDVRAIEIEIERQEREMHALLCLMTGTPAPAEHRGNGRARHKAGAA